MTTDRDAWTKHVEQRKGRYVEQRKDAGVVEHCVSTVCQQFANRPHKYGARPVTVDGIRFDSTKEASRYQELKMRQAIGHIAHLELQPAFPLQIVELWRDGPPWTVVHCGMYTADFRYVDTETGEIVVEDTKSGPTKTTAYALRKRIAEAIHGMTIREV